jgi:hypothetical protein
VAVRSALELALHLGLVVRGAGHDCPIESRDDLEDDLLGLPETGREMLWASGSWTVSVPLPEQGRTLEQEEASGALRAAGWIEQGSRLTLLGYQWVSEVTS